MNAATKRIGELKKLELEIHSDLTAIQSLLAHTHQLLPEGFSESAPSYGNQLAIALCFHHIYSAIEQILLRISKTIDKFTYTGDNWHKEMLKNMTFEVPDARSAIISKQLYPKLDNLRAFRHIVRHAYDYELDWNRLKPICSTIDNTILDFNHEIESFLLFVSQIQQSLQNKS